MTFRGVIEVLSPWGIVGWVSYQSPDGRSHVPSVMLKFHHLGTFSPAKRPERENGLTGFVFELPREFANFDWKEFIDEFDCVEADFAGEDGVEHWRVPLFKSVVNSVANRTALQRPPGELHRYAMDPKPQGRIAAITTVYNEPLMLPLWARYYAKEFGPENVFIVDHESTQRYRLSMPKGVAIIRVPRDAGDSVLVVRMMGLMQRFLLESYDTVVYTDSDEFVCADPEVLQGRTLREFLLQLPEPIGITTGFNLRHNIHMEEPYDLRKPILAQRRVIQRAPAMDKPVVSRVPLNWVTGFHWAREGGEKINGFYLLHLRWFDLETALRKGEKYRASKWSRTDLDLKLAAYNRAEEGEIISSFRGWAEQIATSDLVDFDPDAEFTLVPEWMRQAITI